MWCFPIPCGHEVTSIGAGMWSIGGKDERKGRPLLRHPPRCSWICCEKRSKPQTGGYYGMGWMHLCNVLMRNSARVKARKDVADKKSFFPMNQHFPLKKKPTTFPNLPQCLLLLSAERLRPASTSGLPNGTLGTPNQNQVGFSKQRLCWEQRAVRAQLCCMGRCRALCRVGLGYGAQAGKAHPRGTGGLRNSSPH